MTKLPQISGQECVDALIKAGFRVRRRESSHMILSKENPHYQTVVPDHKQLDRGTLRAIIRQCGLTVDAFLDLLK
jgi:predicted RNA binding protein YcfA (HicA-like mRNA interferase family)